MIGISFSTLGDPKKPIEEFARLLGASGYDGVELRGRPGAHVHWEDSADHRKEVRKLFDDQGIRIASVSTYLFLANRDAGGPDKPDHRDEAGNTEEIKRWMDLAGDLGAKNLRVFGGGLTEGETHADATPRIARIMSAGAAVNPDVDVALEMHDVWNTSELVGGVLDACTETNCKMLWDVHGMTAGGDSVATVIERIRPERIAYAHLKDHFTLPDGSSYECFLGAGEVPLREIVAALKSADWDGYLDVEWEGVYRDYMPPCDIGIVQGAKKLRELLAE